MASPGIENWLYATVPIDNPQGESGTGFLVFRALHEDQGCVFLVTNKHVVHRDSSKREAVTHLVCHFNSRSNDGSPGKLAVDVLLRLAGGAARYREHPDPDTDVTAVDITDVINMHPQIEKRWATYDLFADSAKREELDITVAEDVLTVGYPLGLRQGDTNFPLVRQGLLATRIGFPFRDKVEQADGGLRERSLRAFLIDGATVPGSSGSPVILKPVAGRSMKNTLRLTTFPPVLLGIVAETKYAPIRMAGGAVPGFAGLGLAFDVETIRETIELFFGP